MLNLLDCVECGPSYKFRYTSIGFGLVEKQDLIWRHHEVNFDIRSLDRSSDIAFFVLLADSLLVLFSARVNSTSRITLPHVDVIVETWVEFSNHTLWTGTRFLAKYLFNEFWNLLDYLMDRGAWLPLSQSIR